MTKSNHLAINKKSDTKTCKTNDEESFSIPDSSYTQFTYSENADMAFNPTLNDQKYSDNLPEDNIEAVLLLMKKSIEVSGKKKK